MASYSYYDNQRDNPRVNRAVYIKYEINDDLNRPVSNGLTTSRDIGSGGVRFLCASIVKIGYIVKLQIKLGKTESIGTIGTVAWAEQVKPGQFLVGVQFKNMKEIDKAKIVNFVNKTAPKD